MQALRRAGAPPSVLYVVGSAMLSAELAAERDTILYPPGSSRWDRSGVHISPEQRSQIAELRSKLLASLREMMGPEYERALAEMAASKPHRYGSLEGAKLAQVASIEADYALLRNELRLTTPAASQNEVLKKLEGEMLRDLAATLTPQEYKDYVTFNSSHARELQQRFRGAALDDRQFTEIVEASERARNSFQADGTQRGLSEDSVTFRLAQFEAMSAAAPAEAMAAFASRADLDFGRMTSIFRSAGDSDTGLVTRYREYLQYFAQMERIQVGSATREEVYRLGQPVAAKAYASLTSGLNESQRRRFNATPFGANLLRMGNIPGP
jgi:hypothetical protein